MVSDSQWAVFCTAFALAELLADPRLVTNNDRVRARSWLMPVLRLHMQAFTAAELGGVFEQNGLPFAPITRPEDLFADPHLLATGGLARLVLNDGRSTQVPLMPITLDGKRPGLRSNPPQLGEHTDALLTEVGYTEAEIMALRAAGSAA